MLSVWHRRSAFSSRACVPGRAARTSPAAPATCGEAIEVPLATQRESSLPYRAITVFTPFAVRSGKNRAASPNSGPREENVAIARLLSHAPTARPFAVEELKAEEAPSFPAPVTGRTFAFSAQASRACWLTSTGLG